MGDHIVDVETNMPIKCWTHMRLKTWKDTEFYIANVKPPTLAYKLTEV